MVDSPMSCFGVLHVQTQVLPVNIYREQHRIMVAALLPGMEPQNIHVEIDGYRLTIAASPRGPGQQRTQQFVQEEWTAGPYRRTVELPVAVDGAAANATYDNGVLVVILPIVERPVGAILAMLKVGTAKGQLIRHVGLEPRPR